MRFFSTPQSAEEGEISLLAIVETIAVVSLSFWIAVQYQSVTHIWFGACFAPLFLLRTPKSTEFAHGYGFLLLFRLYLLFFKWGTAVDYVKQNQKRQPFGWLLAFGVLIGVFFSVLLLFVAISIGSFGIWVASIIFGVFNQSLAETIRAIPNNWKRLTWATDFLHPPEVIPGIETIPRPPPPPTSFHAYYCRILSEWRFTNIFRSLLSRNYNPARPWSMSIVFGFLSFPLFVIIYIPVVLCRLSVKATSIVYIPLIYVIKQPLSDLSPREILGDIAHGKYEAIKRAYAWLTLCTYGVSFATVLLSLTFLNWLIQAGGPVARVLANIFLPTDGVHITVKSWHVAQFANALLTLWIWFWADRAARRIDAGRWPEERVKTIIVVVQRIQVLLVGLSVLCTLAILYEFKFWNLLPRIEFQWFPL